MFFEGWHRGRTRIPQWGRPPKKAFDTPENADQRSSSRKGLSLALPWADLPPSSPSYAIYYPNPRAVELQGRVEWSFQSHHTCRKRSNASLHLRLFTLTLTLLLIQRQREAESTPCAASLDDHDATFFLNCCSQFCQLPFFRPFTPSLQTRDGSLVPPQGLNPQSSALPYFRPHFRPRPRLRSVPIR